MPTRGFVDIYASPLLFSPFSCNIMASGSFPEFQVKSYDFEPLAGTVTADDSSNSALSERFSDGSEEDDAESDSHNVRSCNTDW